MDAADPIIIVVSARPDRPSRFTADAGLAVPSPVLLTPLRALLSRQEQRGARVSSQTASAARLLSTVRPHRNVAPMRRMS